MVLVKPIVSAVASSHISASGMASAQTIVIATSLVFIVFVVLAPPSARDAPRPVIYIRCGGWPEIAISIVTLYPSRSAFSPRVDLSFRIQQPGLDRWRTQSAQLGREADDRSPSVSDLQRRAGDVLR